MSATSDKNKQEHPFAGMLRLLELPLSIACMTGIFFKLMHWPGASLLMLLSLSSLSMFYLFAVIAPGGVNKGTATDKLIRKLNGVGSSIAAIAVLFRLMRWPGSSVMIMISGGMLLASLVYMISSNTGGDTAKRFETKAIFRTAGILALEILLFMTPQYR